MSRSDGSTADYYQLPDDCTELQHLISHRDMNAQIGEIFRACYRYGQASHSDRLRDAKKILFYAQAEVARLERMELPRSHPMTPNVWDETRADVIGQNGNDGEHYINVQTLSESEPRRVRMNCGGASFEESAGFEPAKHISAADGAGVWTVWNGGECPADRDARVEVFYDHDTSSHTVGPAHSIDWLSVTRYRLL